MAASLDQEASDAGIRAQHSQRRLQEARAAHADAYLRYIRAGRAAGWSWRRIGAGLALSDRAVRQYWNNHRQRAGRL